MTIYFCDISNNRTKLATKYFLKLFRTTQKCFLAHKSNSNAQKLRIEMNKALILMEQKNIEINKALLLMEQKLVLLT